MRLWKRCFYVKTKSFCHSEDTNSRNKPFPVDSSLYAPDESQLSVTRLGAVSCKTPSLYLALQLPDAKELVFRYPNTCERDCHLASVSLRNKICSELFWMLPQLKSLLFIWAEALHNIVDMQLINAVMRKARDRALLIKQAVFRFCLPICTSHTQSCRVRFAIFVDCFLEKVMFMWLHIICDAKKRVLHTPQFLRSWLSRVTRRIHVRIFSVFAIASKGGGSTSGR
jgi:hypothetical protein